MAANFDNLALRPEFVRQGLRLSAAQLVKVDEAHDDGSVLGKTQKIWILKVNVITRSLGSRRPDRTRSGRSSSSATCCETARDVDLLPNKS